MCVPTFFSDFVLTCLACAKVKGVIARGTAEIFTNLMLPLVRRDGYGLAMPSAVFLLKHGMHCDCFKETVMYHIKGLNCETSYQPRFQASQWSQSLSEGQSCFCEIFCPGSNSPTSSSPVTTSSSIIQELKR